MLKEQNCDLTLIVNIFEIKYLCIYTLAWASFDLTLVLNLQAG